MQIYEIMFHRSYFRYFGRFRCIIKNTIHTVLASIKLDYEIIPILYGGSVNPSNTASFMNYSEINGVLVGSASLKDKDFIEIAKIASQS